MIVTIVGQLSALNTQKFTAVLETLQKQQTADVAAHDAAFTRSGDGGVFVRRTMLFMAFAILGLCPFIFAFFEDIPVAVETLEQSGGWLWGLIPEKDFTSPTSGRSLWQTSYRRTLERVSLERLLALGDERGV